MADDFARKQNSFAGGNTPEEVAANAEKLRAEDAAANRASFDSAQQNNIPGTMAQAWIRNPDLYFSGVSKAAVEKRTNPLQNYLGAVRSGVQGPGQAFSNTQLANMQQARQQQANIIQDLHRAAQGDPNSLAQQQLRQSGAQARGAAASMAGAIRGQGVGSAMRGLGATQANMGMQQNAQAQQLQMQERIQAQNALAAALQGQRAGDIGQSGLGAGILNQRQTQNDDVYTRLLGGMRGASNMADQTELDYLGATTGADIERQRLDMAAANQLSGAGAGMLGSGISILDSAISEGEKKKAAKK